MEPVNRPSLPPEVRAELDHGAPDEGWRAERLWNLLGRADAGPAGVLGTEEAWAELAGRLGDDSPADGSPWAADRPARHSTRRRIGWTAGTLAALALAVGLWTWKQPLTVEAAPGLRQVVELPDGSRVELNSGSRLVYARRFARWPGLPDGERRVVLHGEAYFEVTPAERLFVVETFNARVEVLGTRFNVRAWPGQAEAVTQVTLAEGRVRAAPREASGTGVLLEGPGQGARIARAEAAPPAVEEVALDQALAWRRGGFAMVDEPVEAVLAEIRRRFDVSVETEPGLVLTDSLTLLYRNETNAAAVIHDLCLARGWQYRREGEGFVLWSTGVRRP